MSIKKDFQNLDAVWGAGRYIMLSDEQYADFRPVLRKLLNEGYIIRDTQIDNADNVFVKTNQYKFFLEDLRKKKQEKCVQNGFVGSKKFLGWLFGIIATIIAALILYYCFGIQN